jgi:hypothetical protein
MLDTTSLVLGVICGVAGAAVGEMAFKFRQRAENKKACKESAVLRSDSDHSTVPEVMVKMVPAVNGRLLEVSTKKSNPMHHGHFDWEHEMFIVEEGQTLSQAIAMVMIMKGLER